MTQSKLFYKNNTLYSYLGSSIFVLVTSHWNTENRWNYLWVSLWTKWKQRRMYMYHKKKWF